MILFYYKDKKHNDYIGNEALIFDADHKKIILNNENWYFMIVSDDIDSSDPSTAASLSAIQKLKLHISKNYLLVDDPSILDKIKIDPSKFTIDTSNITKDINRLNSSVNGINSSISKLNSSISDIEKLIGIANTKDNIINSYSEVEAFLKSVSDSSTLIGILTKLESDIKKDIPTKLSDLINDSSFITEDNLYDELDNVYELIEDLSTALTEKSDINEEQVKEHFELLDNKVENLEQLYIKLDKKSFYNKHVTDNSLIANSSIEVGQILGPEYFSKSAGTASYGYPEQQKEWNAGIILIRNIYVEPGVNKDIAQCTFKLDFENEYPVLKTYLGQDLLETLISSNETETLNCNITGYYNWGWTISDNKNNVIGLTFNNEQMTGNLNDVIIKTNLMSSYVYIALPVNYNIDCIKVQSPFDSTEFNEVFNFSKITNNITIEKLSTINKYNIWCCGKSHNNSDDTVTPNAQAIKITTQLA